MAVIELVDKYASGRGEITAQGERVERILIADSYENWRTDPGVPAPGDSWPGNDDLVVVHIGYEGYGNIINTKQTGPFKYTHAKLVVTYSTNTSNDTTLSRKEISGELMEVGEGRYFTESSNPLKRPLCIPIATGTLVIVRKMYPEPTATIMSLLNCVNASAWTYDGYTYPAETVWFAGTNSRLVWDSDAGMRMYEIEFHFKVNLQGWNKSWDGEAGAWNTLYPKPFATGNFTGFPP